jgi:outer membrane immunogenic protein
MKYFIAALAVLSSSTAFAQDADQGSNQGPTPSVYQDEEENIGIGGFRAEIRGGIERPNLSVTDGGTNYVAKLGSSVAYGGEIGYDIPVSKNTTVGPYVSYDLANSDICDSVNPFANERLEICFKAKSNFSVGVRAGFATGPKGELNLSIGYDKYNYDYSEVLTAVPSNAVLGGYSFSGDDGGIGVGFGYNHMIAKNAYIGAGAHITEAGKFQGSDLSLQRFQGHLNIGLRF